MSHSNIPPVRNQAPLTARSSSLRCVSAAEHRTAEQYSKTGRTKPRKHLPRSDLSWNTRQDFLKIPSLCEATLEHWENCLLFVYAPRCVSFFYAPICINAPQKVNLKKMHPAAFYFSYTYTNGISLRIIIKDYIITQTLINETALNLTAL